MATKRHNILCFFVAKLFRSNGRRRLVDYKFHRAIGVAVLSSQFLVPAILQAKEVRYIDLTGVRQRTGLRHPPAPASDCKDGMSCVSSGWGGAGVADGAPDPRDPRELTVQILSAVPDRIDTAQP